MGRPQVLGIIYIAGWIRLTTYKKTMKKITLLLNLLLLLVVSTHAVEKKDAMPVVRSALMLNMAMDKAMLQETFMLDIQPYVDTLQTMLYPQGLDKEYEKIEALGKLTLNSYYALTDNPKVRYNDIGNSIIKLKKHEQLWTTAHVIGAAYYCIKASEQESYDNIIVIGGHGVKVHEKLLNGRENEIYSMLLCLLSEAYFNKRDWKNEVEILTKRLPIVENQSGRSSEEYMESLLMYSQALSMNGDYARADSCLVIMKEILESQGMTDGEMYYDVLSNEAENLKAIGHLVDAENVLIKMKGMCPVGSEYYVATLSQLSEIYTDMYEYEKALDVLNDAITMYESDTNIDVSNLYQWITACQNPLTTNELSRLRKIIEKNTDRKNPIHLCILVAANAKNKDFGQRSALVSQIEQMEKECPAEQRSDLYQYMSQMYLAIEDFNSLIRICQCKLAETEKLVGKNHPLYQDERIMLGEFYSMAGLYHRSIALLDSCAQVEGINQKVLRNIWSEQADIYAKMGDYAKSNVLIKQILDTTSFPSEKTDPLERICVNIICELDLLTTNADEDQTYNRLLVQELLRYSSMLYDLTNNTYGPDNQHTIRMRSYKVAACYFSRDYATMQKETEIFEQELMKKVKNRELRNTLLELLAFPYMKAGMYEHALSLVDRSSLSTPNALFIEKQSTLSSLAEIYMAMGKQKQARQHFIQMAKLIESEAKNAMKQMSQSERQMYWRIYRQALLDAGKYVNSTGTQDAFNGTMYNVAMLAKNMLLESASLHDNRETNNLTWESIRESLHDGELAAEFVLFNNMQEQACYGVILLMKDWEYPTFELIGEKLMIDEQYLSVETDVNAFSKFWDVITPYTKGVHKLYFAPVSRMHTMPLELGVKEGIMAYRLTSTSEIAMKKQCKIKQAAIFGGLLYDELPLLSSTGERAAVEVLPYLPATKKEAEDIAAEFRNANCNAILYIGAEGTEKGLKRLANTDVSVLHVATHGFYEAKNVDGNQGKGFYSAFVKETEDQTLTRGGLYMSGAQRALDGESIPEYEDDGILTAQEISTLNLQGIDLVTLSACETAKGDITGDGVFGLQRGFKKAGANSILMSLWKVDDAATCKLMTEFYSNWIGKKMTKHNALEAAKKTVRETKGWEDPTFWAPFILLDGLD